MLNARGRAITESVSATRYNHFRAAVLLLAAAEILAGHKLKAWLSQRSKSLHVEVEQQFRMTIKFGEDVPLRGPSYVPSTTATRAKERKSLLNP